MSWEESTLFQTLYSGLLPELGGHYSREWSECICMNGANGEAFARDCKVNM